jgi:hypothetical protein
MKKRTSPLLMTATLALAGLVLVPGSVSAEESDLEENLSELAGKAAKAYVAPVVSGFGADFNGGWFHRAPAAKKFDFQFEAGTVFMGAFLQGGAKTFETNDTFRMNEAAAAQLVNYIDDSPDFENLPPATREMIKDSLTRRLAGSEYAVGFEGPTVIGDKNENVRMIYGGGSFTVNVPGVGDQTYEVPADTALLEVTGILDGLPLLPLAAPQLSIGTVMGTNVTLRWLPTVKLTSEIGEMSYFGFGVQHNPGVWFGEDFMPIDLSLGFFTQTFKVGSLFEASSQAFGLNASKTLGFRMLNVTPYAGFMLEKAGMDFSYEREIETEDGPRNVDVKFSLESENKWRGTLGLSLRLLIFNLNGDYNFGKYPSMSVGLMIGV